MNERPTPESDEAQFGTGRVSVDFARRLERERDEAREAFAIATDQLVKAQMENRRLRKELVPEVFRTVLVFSARYVHHRKTGGTMAVCKALDLCWQNLDPQTRKQILKESHEATCNIQEWEDFRKTHQ